MTRAPATLTNRIDAMFAEKRASGERASIFYVTAGYPNYETTEQVVLALNQAGADLIEISIAFSDPIADGPTIQAASQIALQNGATVKGTLELAERLRQKTSIPMILFSAYNPVLHYGLKQFTDDADLAG